VWIDDPVSAIVKGRPVSGDVESDAVFDLMVEGLDACDDQPPSKVFHQNSGMLFYSRESCNFDTSSPGLIQSAL